jgi:hypothetical protein
VQREDDAAAAQALARDAHRTPEPGRGVLDEALGGEARDLGELLGVGHLDAVDGVAADAEAPAAHVEDRACEARDEVALAFGPALAARPLLRADLVAAFELQVEPGGEEPLGRAGSASYHVLGLAPAIHLEQHLGQAPVGGERVPEAREHFLAEDAQVLGRESYLELRARDAAGCDQRVQISDHGLECRALDGRNAHGATPADVIVRTARAPEGCSRAGR